MSVALARYLALAAIPPPSAPPGPALRRRRRMARRMRAIAAQPANTMGDDRHRHRRERELRRLDDRFGASAGGDVPAGYVDLAFVAPVGGTAAGGGESLERVPECVITHGESA